LTATLTGLSPGDYALEAEAAKPGGEITAKTAAFAIVEPFGLAADVIASAGTPPPGPVTLPNRPANATLGESLAAPPVGISGGGEIRAGYVPAAAARAQTP
jgi:hypothetical protein